jgi:hypothetical protein
MLARRRLLGTTLVGGLLGAAMPAPDALAWSAPGDTTGNPPAGGPEGGGQTSDRQVMEIVDALKDIRRAIDSSQGSVVTEIAGVRQKQIEYLRATNKFPDFIDVGLDVWFAVYDWHVKHLQPLVIGRDGNGRYTIALMSTALVMRPDLVPTFVSAPYDNR